MLEFREPVFYNNKSRVETQYPQIFYYQVVVGGHYFTNFEFLDIVDKSNFKNENDAIEHLCNLFKDSTEKLLKNYVTDIFTNKNQFVYNFKCSCCLEQVLIDLDTYNTNVSFYSDMLRHGSCINCFPKFQNVFDLISLIRKSSLDSEVEKKNGKYEPSKNFYKIVKILQHVFKKENIPQLIKVIGD